MTALDIFTWLFWACICILALVIEVTSGTFYLLCFSIGALVTLPFAWLGAPAWVQLLVFGVVSCLCVFLVRPLVMRWFHRSEHHRESNADALIGRVGTVIEPIAPNQPGYVRIDGDEWRAESGQPIEKGEQVTVVRRQSIVLTVVPK